MPQEISKDTTSAQNTQSFQQLFDEALAFQQQKNWDASFTAYQKLLAESLNSLTSAEASVIYNNLSTVAYEKGDLTKAAIWAKKAVALNSNNQQAQLSMEFYAKKVETPSIAHQISNYENIKKVISTAPMDLYFILSLVLIFTSLALYLKNIFRLKKNRLNNDFTTPSKWIFIGVLFITISVISITYIRYDVFSVTKALVLNEASKIQTAAGENKPIIFEAPAGLELEVLNFEQGYYQVKYPGAFTGWTVAENIELLSLGFEQK